MGELKKSAGILILGRVAAHEHGRQLAEWGRLDSRLYERALEVLRLKIDNRPQRPEAANAAGLCMKDMHRHTPPVPHMRRGKRQSLASGENRRKLKPRRPGLVTGRQP